MPIKFREKDSLINSIQGCKYFSQLDYKSGFWQIRLEEDSNHGQCFHVLVDYMNGM